MRCTCSHIGQVEVSVRDQQSVGVDFANPLFGHDDLYANNPIRRVVGTRLGMGMARQIVALHGGRIWADRMEGIGSEAHITLPIEASANPGRRPQLDDPR
jgi:signal transduction histidine kinase